MPTYKNNRAALLYIESRYNPNTGNATARPIPAGGYFIAHSAEIPASWLQQGNPLEGEGPWVTEISPNPTNAELDPG